MSCGRDLEDELLITQAVLQSFTLVRLYSTSFTNPSSLLWRGSTNQARPGLELGESSCHCICKPHQPVSVQRGESGATFPQRSSLRHSKQQNKSLLTDTSQSQPPSGVGITVQVRSAPRRASKGGAHLWESRVLMIQTTRTLMSGSGQASPASASLT